MDLSVPFIKGLPVTDRREKGELWPIYMVVGAFVPFSPKEVQDRYDQERRDRIAAGLEGPFFARNCNRQALIRMNPQHVKLSCQSYG